MNPITIEASLDYDVARPTSFAVAIIAARTPHQSVTSESIEVSPDASLSIDSYGSEGHLLLRFDAPPGPLRIRYSASVVLEGKVRGADQLGERSFGEIPTDVLPYLNPSRYCESDLLGRFAHRLFGGFDSGHGRVQGITDWVMANLRYEPGVTDGSSGTADVLLQRAGVCRDFAHVAISLCRAMNIPARYVAGYGLGVEPQDFHGFFEAYLGDDWYLFDPTGMAPINSLVRIGSGRDAADTPFATFVGAADLTSKLVTVSGSQGAVPEATSTA